MCRGVWLCDQHLGFVHYNALWIHDDFDATSRAHGAELRDPFAEPLWIHEDRLPGFQQIRNIAATRENAEHVPSQIIVVVSEGQNCMSFSG